MPHSYVVDLAFSPDSASLAAVYADGSVVLYDVASSNKRWLAGPRKADATYRIHFSSTGTIVRVAPTSGQVLPYHAQADNGHDLGEGERRRTGMARRRLNWLLITNFLSGTR